MIDSLRCRNGNLEISVFCTGNRSYGAIGRERDHEQMEKGSADILDAAGHAQRLRKTPLKKRQSPRHSAMKCLLSVTLILHTMKENSVRITLNGASAEADSDSVQISEGIVTISAEGTYIISGTLDEGQIVVCVQDSERCSWFWMKQRSSAQIPRPSMWQKR